MKILVIGSTGLVGSALQRKGGAFDLVLMDHSALEIRDERQVRRVLEEEAPDVVINTAAFLGVEPCAANPTEAFAVNTLAVRSLAAICAEREICLVQLSTDAVFDGTKGDLYTEEDVPRPLNLYGMTKYMADRFVESRCEKYYIVRIPILFGLRRNQGNIFIEKMYRLAVSGINELRIADDVISCPSFSDDIAGGILDLVRSGRAYGLYHMRNEGTASLHGFASCFLEKMGVPVEIHRAKASDFSANETELKPLNTAIRSIRIDPLRDWREAMDDYVEQFTSSGKEPISRKNGLQKG